MSASSLPCFSDALVDIAALARGEEEELLGVIAFAVIVEPMLIRLCPESTQRLNLEIAHRLSSRLRATDILYSMGSWEWLTVLPEMRSIAVLTLAMLRLRRAFEEQPLSVDGVEFSLRTVCGAAFYPDDGDDALHLIQSARIACLQANRLDGGSLFYNRN